MERALLARARHYQRHPGVTTLATSGSDLGTTLPDIRDLIREAVREELKKLLPAATSLDTPSVAEIVREELQQALQPEVLASAAPEPPKLSYAAATRRPPPPAHPYTAPPRREPLAPQYSRRHEDRAYVRPEQAAPRKTDVWRTADRRPLCYHCGEADHIYRRCPYRQMGLRGFHPNDPRPRYGERPHDIEEYLRRSPSPVSSLRREARSPSPRRSASPAPRSRRESLSPLRRREN